MLKTASKLCAILAIVSALGTAQATTRTFPPEVMERKASVVNVTTIPAGGTVKVDGVTIPTMPFMLLKKDKPRVVRFELAGYKTLEKQLDPGVHYVIGVGVDSRVEDIESPLTCRLYPLARRRGERPVSPARRPS